MHAGIAASLAPLVCVISCACTVAPCLAQAAAAQAPDLPALWYGARFQNQRISLSRAERGGQPRIVVTEPPSRRAPGTLLVTDLAYDVQREIVYIGTCCEPGSGHLWRVETQQPAAGLQQDDQGFSIDVGGSPPVSARTDTWGTLLFRTAGDSAVNLREGSGVADVAVDGAERQIIALIDSRRLRSVVPTAPQPADTAHDPGLLVMQQQVSGTWRDIKHALPRDRIYCRIVPLHGGKIGLLAGSQDRRNPIQCTGDTLDVYDTASRTRHAAVLKFPQALRHLSIDQTSRFLLFTTVGGAVGWRTLEGEGKLLAHDGFVAADW